MSRIIDNAIISHQQTLDLIHFIAPEIVDCSRKISDIFSSGGKLLICGNGGSAADAQHFASELTGRFERDRPGFPAFALTTDTSALTAIANDYGFENLFARQVESVGVSGDLLFTISTSGHSPNLLTAVAAAKDKKIYTFALLGRDGGHLAKEVDMSIIVPSMRTSRIQEMHLFIIHLLCELLEDLPSQ